MEGKWNNDHELFAMMKEVLYTAVVGDILDTMGYLHQFLPASIRPLHPDMVMAGRAMPVLEADVYTDENQEGNNPVLNQPFGLMLKALDDLKENEIYLTSGSHMDYALVGEIMSARAKKLKAAGAVANGYIRDTKGILALDFPVFACGSYAQDQAPRGRVIDYRVTVQVGDAVVHPGDILFGDIDGVLVIPQKIETVVIQKAYEKATGERTVLKAIQAGMSAEEAFRTYKIM